MKTLLKTLLIGALMGCFTLMGPLPEARPDQRAEPRKSEVELRKSYEQFVDSLDTLKIVREYPRAIQHLLSADPERQVIGLRVLSASGEVEAIPWMVPHLDAPEHNVRTSAGSIIENLVSTTILKQRRDPMRPDRVVIKPLGPRDTDFRPLAWVAHKMLQKDNDPDLQAYAATMIGYIGLKEFGPELKKLLGSRHPAVTNSAKYALELLGLREREEVRGQTGF